MQIREVGEVMCARSAAVASPELGLLKRNESKLGFAIA